MDIQIETEGPPGPPIGPFPTGPGAHLPAPSPPSILIDPPQQEVGGENPAAHGGGTRRGHTRAPGSRTAIGRRHVAERIPSISHLPPLNVCERKSRRRRHSAAAWGDWFLYLPPPSYPGIQGGPHRPPEAIMTLVGTPLD